MTIQEILRSKGSRVITTVETTTILAAVKAMVASRVGALLVTDGSGKPVGIFTERDVLRQVAEHIVNVETTLVGQVMNRDVIIGLPDDDVEKVLGIMTEKRVRHIPVMDGGKLVGMISIGDIVKARLSHTDFEAHHLRDYIMGRY
jgi:CBS domain-containing protein